MKQGLKSANIWLVSASALALAACGGGGSEPADPPPAPESATVESAAQETAAAAEEAAETVEEAATEAADTVTEAADAMTEAATDAAGDATEAAEAVVEDATEAVEDAAAEAEEAATEAVEAVEEAATDAADGVDLSNFRTATAEEVAAYEALTGDAGRGRRAFTKCLSCHVVQEGQNRVGPSLYGIIGRESGSIEGFRYSDANRDSGIYWTEATMFAYLEDPRGYIPGTIMAFPGIPSAQERADIIAYVMQESGQ